MDELECLADDILFGLIEDRLDIYLTVTTVVTWLKGQRKENEKYFTNRIHSRKKFKYKKGNKKIKVILVLVLKFGSSLCQFSFVV
jgi:hypothetical protein